MSTLNKHFKIIYKMITYCGLTPYYNFDLNQINISRKWHLHTFFLIVCFCVIVYYQILTKILASRQISTYYIVSSVSVCILCVEFLLLLLNRYNKRWIILFKNINLLEKQLNTKSNKNTSILLIGQFVVVNILIISVQIPVCYFVTYVRKIPFSYSITMAILKQYSCFCLTLFYNFIIILNEILLKINKEVENISFISIKRIKFIHKIYRIWRQTLIILNNLFGIHILLETLILFSELFICLLRHTYIAMIYAIISLVNDFYTTKCNINCLFFS